MFFTLITNKTWHKHIIFYKDLVTHLYIPFQHISGIIVFFIQVISILEYKTSKTLHLNKETDRLTDYHGFFHHQ